MKITDREQSLFMEWSRDRPEFVSDGIVDEQAYGASTPKLLFVLKEVNDIGGGGWDLRSFIRDGGRAQTWDNVTRWVEGIRNLPSEIRWNALADVDAARRRETLRSIAAVNLKKSPGGPTADGLLLAEESRKDSDYINRQFSLYESEFTICCGTSDLFHSLIKFPNDVNWQQTSRGIWYHEPYLNRYVVAYSHPEARCSSCLLYYGIVDAIREIGGYA